MSNDDFNDDLSDIFTAPLRATPAPAHKAFEPVAAIKARHVERCPRCHGSGFFGRFGTCFRCKGSGKQEYAAPAEERAKNRAQAAERTERKITEKVTGFAAEHPAVADWIAANPGFAFAVSLGQTVEKFGSLTPNQLAAAQRCILREEERRATRQAERALAASSAPAIDVSKIEAAFETARSNGIKAPKLRLAAFTFSPAPEHGKNPGAVYVKARSSREYLGKVVSGQLKCVEAGRPLEAEIIAAAADPAGAAKAYGLASGECSICGRELTDPVSIANGIGPICATKWGF